MERFKWGYVWRATPGYVTADYAESSLNRWPPQYEGKQGGHLSLGSAPWWCVQGTAINQFHASNPRFHHHYI